MNPHSPSGADGASSFEPQPGQDLWVRAASSEQAAEQAPGSAWERGVLERLVFATLREQRSARRWRIFWRFLWVVLIVGAFWLMGRDSAVTTTTGPHTAVVDIKGVIAGDGPASAEFVIAAMRSAMEDPGSKALVLLINSPGGSPVQAGMINDEIVRLKALHDKPVYAVVEETCTSAAYYIAVAADEIFVDKASIVGSIGVLMDGFGFTEVMKKVGVQRRLYAAGDNKGMLDPFSPVEPEQREFVQVMLDQIHQQFIDVVKEGRGDRLKVNDETFSGLFWTGQQAVELGLVDQFGTLDSVARDVVQVEELVDYTRSENIAERFAKRFGAAVGGGAMDALHNMVPALR